MECAFVLKGCWPKPNENHILFDANSIVLIGTQKKVGAKMCVLDSDG